MTSIKKNYIYNVFYQILLVVVPLITIPYISRTLGASGIGKISFAESIVSYFVLFANLGLNTFGQREISYVQDDKKKRTVVFYNVLIAKLIVASFILLVYILCYIFIFKSFIYLILTFQIIEVMIDITWFFQGMEEFGKIVIRNSLVKVLSIIYIYLFVSGNDAIYIYCVGIVLFPIISFISLWVNIFDYFEPFDLTNVKICNILKSSFTLFLPTIAIQVYTVFDKTMIGMITRDSLENGYYEQAIKISRCLLMLITALSTVVIPRVGFHFEKNNHDTVKMILYRSYRFVFMISIPMCLGLFFVSYNFVPWFLGAGFEKSKLLIQIFSLLIIAISLSNVTGLQYFVPSRQQHKLTISVCGGAIINFTLNFILIPYYKSVGACIASVIAELSVTIIQFWLAKDYISYKKIIKSSANYLIAGFIMIFGLYLFENNVRPSVINTFLISASGAGLYFTILLILKDELLIKDILGY